MSHTLNTLRVVDLRHYPDQHLRLVEVASLRDVGMVLRGGPAPDAYAHLFAAAPDLLAACKAALEFRFTGDRADPAYVADLIDTLTAAIAKAEGGGK